MVHKCFPGRLIAMLPKYLPPPYDEKFWEVYEKKKAEGLSLREAFTFVHDAVEQYEKDDLDPLAALDKAHSIICPAPAPKI
jgi:hypothetical protein